MLLDLMMLIVKVEVSGFDDIVVIFFGYYILLDDLELLAAVSEFF